MKKLISFWLLVLSFTTYSVNAQTYKFDSEHAVNNFHNVVNEIEVPSNVLTLKMPPPESDASKNDNNIAVLLAKARQIHKRFPTKMVVIRFEEGAYFLNKAIHLSYNSNDSYTTITGAGDPLSGSLTKLVLNVENEGYLLKITGSNSYQITSSVKYNEVSNYLSVNVGAERLKGKLLDISITNGKWATGKLNLKADYFGQINKSEKILSNKVYLSQSFAVPSKFLDKTNKIKLSAFFPISNIGVENLVLTHKKKFASSSSLIKVDGGYNCWLKSLVSLRPTTSHVSFDRSYNIQIQNCVFIDSYLHGTGGQGYGIAIGGKSTACLVQNNLFYRLRHAIVLSTAANHNIIGYNKSIMQYATNNSGTSLQGLGDIALHGYLPYSNLIEGNNCGLIRADGYWGKNGPYNVFYNNNVETNIQFDAIDYAITKSNYKNGKILEDKNSKILSKSINNNTLYKPLKYKTIENVDNTRLNQILQKYK